jgi:ATP-binding cassette subfamily C protein
MKILLAFARSHPWRSLSMLVCLLVAAGAEALAITSLLPLLSLLAGPEAAAGAAAFEAPEGLEAWFIQGLHCVGLEPTGGTLLLILPAAFWLRGGLLLLARREIGYTIARIERELRLRLVRALLKTSWSYYVEQRVGSFANAYSTEAMRVSKAFLNATWVAMFALQIVVYVGIALAISWKVTSFGAFIGAFVVLVLVPLIRMGRRAGLKQTRLLRWVLGTLTDIFQGVKPLKAMAREERVAPLLEVGTRRMETASRRQVLSREAITALQEPIGVSILCLGVAVMLFLHFKIAAMAVMLLLVQRTLDTLHKAQRRYQRVVVEESAYWSLMETIENAEKAEEHSSGGALPTLERGVALRSVSFRYQGELLFEDLSLEIPAGRITALTGPSGSGKTTIVDLAVGLVKPERGEVLIDGRPLEELDLTAWRRHVGYVPQEMFLLHDTVAMNVALGDPHVSRDDIVRALTEAHAWEFVSRLPDGIDTVVGERGSALSGGQRQRIAIARAMLHDPWLLVLDEATAALDPRSEAMIWEAVKGLRGRATVLAISHQSMLLDVADCVYRVDGGAATKIDAGEVRAPGASAGAHGSS